MDIPASLVTSVGLPGFVILTLFLALLMVVKMIFNRALVPLGHHEEIVGQLKDAIADRDHTIRDLRDDRDKWRVHSENLAEQNAEMLTNQDLNLTAWNSVKAYVAAKEGDL